MNINDDLSFGAISITDYGWYEFLSDQANLDEVNFWTPSAYWGFKADPGTPFFFKLKARFGHAICGFAHFVSFSRLPVFLAWEWFGIKNGCPSLGTMQERISDIRKRIEYKGQYTKDEIGCILLAQPVFFNRKDWIRGPVDWPRANLRYKKYRIDSGEGARIWRECYARTSGIQSGTSSVHEESKRYGEPVIVQPRLGQGTFRVAVMDAYSRACALTCEHSLPALEAAHIKPFTQFGPNTVSNGILLRADLHRLFDQGYLTITSEYKVEVSNRLRTDYKNGRTYYPLHGSLVNLPPVAGDAPSVEYLRWHNENTFRA